MNRFGRLAAAGLLILWFGVSLSLAQGIVYSAGPRIVPAFSLQGLGHSWADVDSNGTLDLVIEPNNLILNSGAATPVFTPVTPSGISTNTSSVGTVIGDINGDGLPDVVMTQGATAPRVFLDSIKVGFVDGTASMGDLATISSGTSGQMYNTALGDFDRDGYLDLIWAGGANQTNNGSGATIFGPDGKLRLLKGSPAGFVNVGTLSASPVVDTTKYFESWNPCFIDVNNDGYPDLFIPSHRNGFNNNNSRSVIYLNNHDGTFSAPAQGVLYHGPADTGIIVNDTVLHLSAIASAWGDFDNDGNMDVVLSGLNGDQDTIAGVLQNCGLRLLQGHGDGTFTDVTAASTIPYNGNVRGISVGDYDNDGLMDILLDAGFAAPQLWHNGGGMVFARDSVALATTGPNSRSGCLVDVNNDGFLDVFVCAGGSDSLLINGGNGNHWIGFRPKGAGHNLMAIGARFTIYTDGGFTKQVRTIQAGGSGGAGNGPVWANFGLGSQTTVDSIVVNWPDGTTQGFVPHDGVDKYYYVQEGVVIPGKPVLASPANGAVDQPSSLSLAWHPVENANGYHVQVSLDPTFQSAIVVNDSTADTTRALSGLGFSSVYFWRVASYTIGFSSGFSTADSFTTVIQAPVEVPTLIAPANNAINQPAFIRLVVSKTTDAARYHWQVSTSPAFATFAVNDSTVDTAQTVGPLASGTKYYWHVRGVNPGGAAAYSVVDSFTVTTAPVVPLLVFPAVNQTSVKSDTLKLVWRAAPGALGYECKLSLHASLTPLVVTADSTSDTTFTVIGLAHNTQYYWTVRAFNIGGPSAFAAIDSFTTIVPLPAAPGLVSPTTNQTVKRHPIFVWRSSQYATRYRIQIATTNGYGATTVADTTVADTTVNLLSTLLAASTAHYWHVAGIDTLGQGSYSPSRLFLTNTDATDVDGLGGIPTVFALQQNYPNPFNPSTVIRYDVPKAAHVSIVIYDILGRVVTTLVNESQTAGRFAVEWRPTGLASGIYFLRMEARADGGQGSFTSMKKLLLMK